MPDNPGSIPSLTDQLLAVAGTGAGHLGVAATDLETGETLSYAGRDPFPMASTVKVAIAATYLAGVDSGRFSLDQLYRRGRMVVSADRLIEAMMIHSDNGAADMLLRAVGGPVAINAWLAHAGIRGQHMDRTIARLIYDDRGGARAMATLPLGMVSQTATFSNDGEVDPKFAGDARDTSTPSAMIALLARLHSGALLTSQSTQYLFDVMARCVTGPHRIKGALPAGTPVAHKTGTLAGVSDDVGIVTLPNGHHLALAIFAKGMRSEWERDKSIAALTRILYDGFGAVEQATAQASMGLTSAR